MHPPRAGTAELNADVGEFDFPAILPSLAPTNPLFSLFHSPFMHLPLSLPMIPPLESDAIDGASSAVSNPSTGSPCSSLVHT